MRLIPIIIIGLMLCQSLLAQLPYNHRLENGQVQAIGQLVYELDDSYLGIGRGIDTIDYLRGIYATEFDKVTGEVLSTDKVTFLNSSLFFDRLNKVINVENKPYYLFGRSDTIYLSSYSELNREININKKFFSIDSLNSLFIYDFYFKAPNFYIIAEHFISNTGISKPLLFTYNLNSEVTTEEFLIDSNEFIKKPRMQILQNEKILVTYSIKIDNENIQFLEEIDLEGNQIWKYENENKRESFVNSFIPMSDSTFILGGIKSKDTPNTTDDEVIPYLLKFNYNQKKVTARSDFEIPEDEWFWLNGTVEEIVPSHDSTSFLCVSELYDFPLNPDTLKSYGMIAKVDHDLNLIWKRTYFYIDNVYYRHRFEDIIATTDGNYLAYGSSYKIYIYPGEIPLLSWAIKIDEDGYIVGDTSTATVEWEHVDFTDKIEIFPNPASDYIYINQNDIEDVQYSVYDLNGSFIESFTLSDKNQSVVKSVDKWDSGYHIIRLTKGGKPIGSIKILKI